MIFNNNIYIIYIIILLKLLFILKWQNHMPANAVLDVSLHSQQTGHAGPQVKSMMYIHCGLI